MKYIMRRGMADTFCINGKTPGRANRHCLRTVPI